MSSRDDSLLYTGVTSASMKVQQRRKEQLEDKEAKQAFLSPTAELLMAEIKKDRDAIGAELGNLIHLEMTAEDVKATVLGLRLADQRLVSLQHRLVNILRRPKVKESDDE